MVLSYYQYTAEISTLMTKTVPSKHTCVTMLGQMGEWSYFISISVFCFLDMDIIGNYAVKHD